LLTFFYKQLLFNIARTIKQMPYTGGVQEKADSINHALSTQNTYGSQIAFMVIKLLSDLMRPDRSKPPLDE
jgi:hypothetical protein